MFSPLAGILVSKYGPQALFNASLAAGVLGILPTTMLPTYALKNRGKPLAIDPAIPVIAEERPGDEAATTFHQDGHALEAISKAEQIVCSRGTSNRKPQDCNEQAALLHYGSDIII